jgi:hypothetical protein
LTSGISKIINSVNLEQISKKIEILEKELALETDGSLTYDTILIEINYLKTQLKKLKESK